MTPVNPGVIQNPGLWRKLTSKFGIKSRTATPELGAVLHPVVLMEDLTRKSYYDTQEFSCAGGAGLTSAVGNTAKVQLRNPIGSSIIAVVLSITVEGPATNDAFLEFFDGTAATLVANRAQFLDRRSLALAATTPIPACEIHIEDSAVTPIGTVFAAMTFSTTIWNTLDLREGPIILRPGNTVVVESGAAAQKINALFHWLELPAERP